MQAVRFYGERVELGHADKKVGRRGFLPAIHRREIRSDREFVRILRSLGGDVEKRGRTIGPEKGGRAKEERRTSAPPGGYMANKNDNQSR